MFDIVFGDNHYFGINHLSTKKAEEYRAAFRDPDYLAQSFAMLKEHGIEDQMLSAHQNAQDVCKVALNTHPTIQIHPVIPYAHAINDSAAARGISETALGLLRPSFIDALTLAWQSVAPWMTVDIPRSSVARFLDKQLKIFGPLPVNNRGTLFLHNVFTDLLIGLGLTDWFENYRDLCNRRGYRAGAITYNPGFFFRNAIDIEDLCINYNHVGFLNNISDPELTGLCSRYSVWAMGIFGSGAYDSDDVVPALRKHCFDSVVFATSRRERLSAFLTSVATEIRRDAP